MYSIEFNTKDKAERCILAGRKTHKLHWQKYYYTDKDGAISTKYIVFYKQR